MIVDDLEKLFPDRQFTGRTNSTTGSAVNIRDTLITILGNVPLSQYSQCNSNQGDSKEVRLTSSDLPCLQVSNKDDVSIISESPLAIYLDHAAI